MTKLKLSLPRGRGKGLNSNGNNVPEDETGGDPTQEPGGTTPTQPTDTTQPPDDTTPTQPTDTTQPPDDTTPTQPTDTTQPPDDTAPTQPTDTTQQPDDTAPTQPTDTTQQPDDTAPTQPTEGTPPASSGSTIYVTNALELAAALKAATGGETILLKQGVYDPVWLKDLLPGSTVTIASADPENPAVLTGLVIRDSANITVRNVEMLDLDAATLHDFRIESSSDITVDQVKVSGLDRDNSAPVMIRYSSDVAVTNSEFTHVRYAVSMLDNSGITVSGNYFHDNRADGLRGGGNSDVVISDNFFTNFRPLDGDHPDAIQFWTTNTTTSAENIRITGNVIVRGDGGPTQGIFMRDEVGNLPYKNVVIEGNLVVGTRYHGIRVGKAEGLTVSDNTVVGFPDQKSWISVPADAVLLGNSAQLYTIGGVSVDFLAGNTLLPASRDGGAALISDWLTDHTSSYAHLLTPYVLAAAAAPPPPTLVIEGTEGADRLGAAKAEDSILLGHAGNDILYGQVPEANVQSRLEGGTGNDVYHIRTDRDLVVENADGGADTVNASISYTLTDNVETLRLTAEGLVGRGNAGDNRLIGTSGSDTLHGEGGNDTVQGLDGDDVLYGEDGDDGLSGEAGDDRLHGGAGNDRMGAGEGNDYLDGGDGDDWLEGGAGSDMLIGGSGRDTLAFRQADLGFTDTIADYNRTEDAPISLRLIDANTLTLTNDAFSFIGTAEFSNRAGELRYSSTSEGVLVQGDVNGDGIADLSLTLLGLQRVSAGNFML